MHTSGDGQGVLLKDGAEISAAEVRALTQKVDAMQKDLNALKASAGMWFKGLSI